MHKRYRRKMLAYVKLSHYRSAWRKIVRAMACLVVFCTTYALILPAITMEQTHSCGLEFHEHSDSCYTQKELRSFTCLPQDGEIHLHEDRCFDAVGYQICPYTEKDVHSHEDGCYEGENLICGREALQLHTHSEECSDENGASVCALPELISHVHSEICTHTEWEAELTCTREVHVHDASCDSDPEADLETREDWEQTVEQVAITGNWKEDLVAIAGSQIGYQESTRNFVLDAEGNQKGYTRYGGWHGVPYGKWDSMFVSFCLEYAGIPEEAISRYSNTREWFETLQNENRLKTFDEPDIAAGDVAFFGNEDGQVEFVAILTEAQWDNTEENSPVLYLQYIAGDRDDEVAKCDVTSEDTTLLGFVSMEELRQQYDALQTPAEETQALTEPAETEATVQPLSFGPVTQTAETENYLVTVSYSDTVVLPAGAELRVFEYPKNSEIFLQRCAEAGYELEWLLNIGFVLEDTELTLEGGFDVVVTSKQGKNLADEITHFSDHGTEQIDGENDGEASVAFSSESFSDFGGTVVLAAARAATVEYTLVTANPAQLQEGVDYVVYFGNNDNFTFFGRNGNSLAARQVNGTNKWYSPYYSGNQWILTADQMGTTELSDIAWRIVKEYQYYYLQSTKDGKRIRIFNDVQPDGGSWLQNVYTGVDTSRAGTKLEAEWYGSINYLRYNNGWVSTGNVNDATVMYFAQVTQTGKGPNYPQAVGTGEVDINRLRFYNICEDGENGVSALAGCVFEIEGENGYKATVVSEDTPEVNLPEDIPDGVYTITEVSTPSGYMRDTEYTRTFTVQDGMLVSDKTIGTFINHDAHRIKSDKTGEVEDYNNRIYQILLSAESHMRMYEMDPVDVLFVVDQSNSMLFPSGLNPTGKSVTLKLDGSNNVRNMDNLNLDKNQVYYIISDPSGTSTVWAVWHDGTNWLYQDASYYAKAWYENGEGYQDPNETAIFPQNRSYADQSSKEDEEAGGTNVRANGGGLGFSLTGGGLGNYIDSLDGDTGTFEVYTASGEYNRLHYLEEALANMIYTLADVNDQNRVTLTEFTKEVAPENDMGPLTLSPDNVEKLVYEVRHIDTSGGTRQDIALKHVYENHLNDSGENYSGSPTDTYTILITDGAPVRSSGSNLNNVGSPNDAPSTTADSIYAQIKGYAELVRSKSTLMTVGLGMDKVEGGKQVLQEIATDSKFNCALDDAAELVKQMQDLMFEAFRAKDLIPMIGNVEDEISDSFYPIAWTAPSQGGTTGRKVLLQDGSRDWVMLESGDWINLEGKYTVAGAADAAGQLLRREDGTFYIQWNDVQLSYPKPENPYEAYNPEGLAWVNEGHGGNTGRTVIASYGGKDWIELRNGDYITQEGQYYSGTPSYWNRRYYGQYSGGSVTWGSSANDNNRIFFEASKVPLPETQSQWKGTFYVKAKEDFIGGNAIDTNKSAKVTAIVQADRTVYVEKPFETPTVNVRLLGMNQQNSEVTVYLGDIVNEEGDSPLDSLKRFYDNTLITKILPDDGNIANKFAAAETDGLEASHFYLRYALGADLSDEQWQNLINGQSVTVAYAYDKASSQGEPVGEFTFRLEKTGMPGANPDFGSHEATAACQPGGQPLTGNCDAPAETYTLHITYEAYGLGENGRPEANVHNGTGSPGTEVGTGATLETGLGIVEKQNVHEVHVISGAIKISKQFAQGITDDEEQTFTFVFHRTEDGEDTSRDITRTITIPANASAGSSSITVEGLRRGTYTVTEAPDEDYMVDSIQVLNTTNCYSEPAIGGTAQTLTFVMGSNASNNHVIGRFSADDQYTSYIDPVNGVFGEAIFTNRDIVFTGQIPVNKVWSDGPEVHSGDAVYVVLYLDDIPVKDTQDRGRILRLDARNNWQGSFEVVLSDETDSVTNYNYSVREVSHVSDDHAYRDTWHPAILEQDNTLLYYEKALEANSILGANGGGYLVQYEPGENGAWTVKNNRTVDLPMTGGMGTHLYTFSGLLLMTAALMYGCSQRRKRERRNGFS